MNGTDGMDGMNGKVRRYDSSDEAIEEVAAALLSGGVGVIPTDTVYGVAAHPGNASAVERLYTVKGRDGGKPIALLASDADAVARFGFPLGGKAAELAGRGWPGALTLVVENSSGRTEGFRVPAHEWTRKLLAKCGGVLRVTSANISGRCAAANAADALAQLGDSIDFIVDDGPSRIGTASQVIKVSPSGETSILRK